MKAIQDFIYVEDIDVIDNMLKALKQTEFRTKPHLLSETRENVI